MSNPSSGHDSGATLGPEERVLIERSQHGDFGAFDQLVLRHQNEVYAVSVRMLGDPEEAKDVAQDVFVRAYQSIGTFRGESALSTWLVSITMNLCRNRRRWWARRRGIIVASLDDPVETGEGTMGEQIPDPSSSPAEDAERREQRQRLAQTLQLLEEPYRSVIVLRDIQGYSYEEIAQMVGCRVGTVKSRINRARLQLRALWDGRL